nr:hypothetical protein CFP56_69032 [Quercus suber]
MASKSLTFKVSSPKNLLEDHTRISELIDSERGGWKAEVVKSVWNATSNGMFSVQILELYGIALVSSDSQQCSDDALSFAISFARAMWTRRN